LSLSVSPSEASGDRRDRVGHKKPPTPPGTVGARSSGAYSAEPRPRRGRAIPRRRHHPTRTMTSTSPNLNTASPGPSSRGHNSDDSRLLLDVTQPVSVLSPQFPLHFPRLPLPLPRPYPQDRDATPIKIWFCHFLLWFLFSLRPPVGS